MKLFNFVSYLTGIAKKKAVKQHPISGSDIGLAQNRRHAIIWNKMALLTDAYLR